MKPMYVPVVLPRVPRTIPGSKRSGRPNRSTSGSTTVAPPTAATETIATTSDDWRIAGPATTVTAPCTASRSATNSNNLMPIHPTSRRAATSQ